MDIIVYTVFFVIYIICFSFLYVKNTEYLSIAVISMVTFGFALYSMNTAYMFISSNAVNANFYYSMIALSVAVFGLVAQMVASFLFAMGMVNINLKFEINSRIEQHVSPKYVIAINEFKKNTVIITTFCFILLFSLLYKPDYIRKPKLPILFLSNIIAVSGIIMFNSVNQYTNAVEFVKIKNKKSLGLFSQTNDDTAVCATQYTGMAAAAQHVAVGKGDDKKGNDWDMDCRDIPAYLCDQLKNDLSWNYDLSWGIGFNTCPAGEEPVEEDCEEEQDYENWVDTWKRNNEKPVKEKEKEIDKTNVLQILATETEQGNPGKRQRFFEFSTKEKVYITTTGIVIRFPTVDKDVAYNFISLLEIATPLSTAWDPSYNTAGTEIKFLPIDATSKNLPKSDKYITTNSDVWDKLSYEMEKAGRITMAYAIADKPNNTRVKILRSNNDSDNWSHRVGYITPYNCFKTIPGPKDNNGYIDWSIVDQLVEKGWNAGVVEYTSPDPEKVAWKSSGNDNWTGMGIPGTYVRARGSDVWLTVIPATGWY